MTGTKFGCGMALCGACTVHVDGAATRSCVLPLSAVAGKSITTIEGLSADRSHAVQRAWLEIDVPQCGYCQSGQIMSAAALLKANPTPKRCRYRRGDVRQYLPLRHLSQNPQGHSPRRGICPVPKSEHREVRPAFGSEPPRFLERDSHRRWGSGHRAHAPGPAAIAFGGARAFDAVPAPWPAPPGRAAN